MRRLLEESSRLIDRFCERHFYIWNGIKYYDGAESRILFLQDDLQSISQLVIDDDGDGVYDETYSLTATIPDAFLRPYNKTPKTELVLNPESEDYSDFAPGYLKNIKITGVFGHGNDYPESNTLDSGSTTTEELDASETGVDVTDGSDFAVGQTILVESEQMFLTGISSNTLTVQRGINGTTAATHATSKTVYIYQYPAAIVQGCLIQTIRSWKRRESAFQNVVTDANLGSTIVYKGLDPDVQAIIREYRKVGYA